MTLIYIAGPLFNTHERWYLEHIADVLEKNGYCLESVRRKGILKNDLLIDDFVWVKQKIY